VVIVEADGDRLVYSTVLESLSAEFRLDVHFAAIGGSGGIADTCTLYQKLRIPVAVIADLDVITDHDRLARVVASMVKSSSATRILDLAKAVLEDVRRLPPTVEESTFKSRLFALAQASADWAKGDDYNMRRELSRLASDLDRMRRLKSGGIENFPKAIATQLIELITSLKEHGIFLVPVGELEGWLSAENVKASKSSKWSWANEAALAIQSKGPQPGDIWDFVREVAAYLRQDLSAGTPSAKGAT
jgi:hypothetical protein